MGSSIPAGQYQTIYEMIELKRHGCAVKANATGGI